MITDSLRYWVTWLVADGSEITQAQWVDDRFRCFGMLLGGKPDVCLLIINGSAEDVVWTLPRICAERGWFVGIDTSEAEAPHARLWRDPVYQIRAGSLALLHTKTLLEAGELKHGTTTHDP